MPNPPPKISRAGLSVLDRAARLGRTVIDSAFAQTTLASARRAANTLSELSGRGRLLTVKRGVYLIVPAGRSAENWSPDPLLAGKCAVAGAALYYVGYQAMFRHWGFAPSLGQGGASLTVVQVANDRFSRSFRVGEVHVQAVKVPRYRIFGTFEISVGRDEILASDFERSLVDLIDRMSNGPAQVRAALQLDRQPAIFDVEKFERYVVAFRDVGLARRAGYLLEEAGTRSNLDRYVRRPIRSLISLDKTNPSRRGRIVREWGLILND